MPRQTNDPVGVRNFIKAPDEHLIFSYDYSQIELRVGAHYCQDPVMIETYRTGGDIHSATTSVIFGCSYEEAQNKHRQKYKEQRTIAKNVNFGTFYGLFPRGLQKTLKFKAGVIKSISECEVIINNLKVEYPGLTTWQEETKYAASRRMYSETKLGRRRYLPNINSSDWGNKSFAERRSLNTPIQGTAADILKIAISRILKGLPERPWLRPILQIHDELTFVIPKERLEEAVAYIKGCMEYKPFDEFDLPLIVEASVGETFGTMEELDEGGVR
jgi:DNA polymerase-1